jgi:hypothetical protein
MRAQVAAALLLLSGFVSLWAGCSRKPTPPPCPPPFLTNEKRRKDVRPCVRESDCPSADGECVAGKCSLSGACVRDADCRSGFCDRGLCVPLSGPWGPYGAECKPLPPPEERPNPLPSVMDRLGPSENCGNYPCIDRRCRSCKEDAECGELLICASKPPLPGKLCVRRER